jgi:hypothetical protein
LAGHREKKHSRNSFSDVDSISKAVYIWQVRPLRWPDLQLWGVPDGIRNVCGLVKRSVGLDNKMNVWLRCSESTAHDEIIISNFHLQIIQSLAGPCELPATSGFGCIGAPGWCGPSLKFVVPFDTTGSTLPG